MIELRSGDNVVNGGACGRVSMFFTSVCFNYLRMEIKTKSRGGCCRLRLIGAVGDASQKTSFPHCHHRHHQCHALHDDNSHHGSKSGRRPFKKSAFGGEKIAACGSPSLTLPKGRECQPGVVLPQSGRSHLLFGVDYIAILAL